MLVFEGKWFAQEDDTNIKSFDEQKKKNVTLITSKYVNLNCLLMLNNSINFQYETHLLKLVQLRREVNTSITTYMIVKQFFSSLEIKIRQNQQEEWNRFSYQKTYWTTFSSKKKIILNLFPDFSFVFAYRAHAIDSKKMLVYG